MTVTNILYRNRLWTVMFLMFGMLAGSVNAASDEQTNESVIVLDVKNMT